MPGRHNTQRWAGWMDATNMLRALLRNVMTGHRECDPTRLVRVGSIFLK